MLPDGFHREPPAPKPEPVLASALADNVVYMNQMTTPEIWCDDTDQVSSDGEE